MEITENPLLKTLPPAIDYLNYLIVIEHNLDKSLLPTLHDVLQDTKLTANIGWDLVHQLLPLLPQSRQCLQDVAQLGNPREVVLKVTELLGGIKDEAQEDEVEEDEVQENAESPAEEDQPPQIASAREKASPAKDLRVIQYVNLVEMLGILHPRIKTQYPSRFLSTSLQAALPAYAKIAHDPVATQATLNMIKTLSPTQRPRLPPRKSSSRVPQSVSVADATTAPDPEGRPEPVGTDEAALQTRLIQSFLTFVAEGYVSSLKLYEDIPGLAWSCRYYEKKHPDKRIPGRPSYLKMFIEEEEELHRRDTILGQCLAISRDLKIHPLELLTTVSHEDPPENEDEEALPSKASDVPLSRSGSLYLFCALAASSFLFDVSTTLPAVKMFPDYLGILANSLPTAASSSAEYEATIDAVLFLGHLSLSGGMPDQSDVLFHDCLQRLSLLSANTPSAVLRYQAHVLTSSILHLHPRPNARLAFIMDTLEHCPYENLKASAVGWLKDEILAARDSNSEDNIFATSAVLRSTAPLLLLEPSKIASSSTHTSQSETYAVFEQNQAFILAVHNLLYLLLSSTSLMDQFQIKAIGKDFDIVGYCDQMRAASLLFQGWSTSEHRPVDIQEDDGGRNARLAGFQLLDEAIERVTEAAGKAGIL